MAKTASSAPTDRSNLDELPFMPLWVMEHLGQTAVMNLEQRGAYLDLLLLCWMTPGCRLPREHARIRAEIRVSADDFNRVVLPLLRSHFPLLEGHRTNRKLQQLYIKQRGLVRRKSEAGRRGGIATALHAKKKIPSSAADLLSAETRQWPSKPEQEQELELNLASQQLVGQIREVLGPGAAPEISDGEIERAVQRWSAKGATASKILQVIRVRTANPRPQRIRSLRALDREFDNLGETGPTAPITRQASDSYSFIQPETESGRKCLAELIEIYGPPVVAAWLREATWSDNAVVVSSPLEQQHVEMKFGRTLQKHGYSVELRTTRDLN
jgi:uncharacterized protein YdaU (DUF1376 family)